MCIRDRYQELAKGGWIRGPQSGYPVSLDGGRSTSFIGHGTEYVAQKSGGGFVVPVDTPATRKNPSLMGQRMSEGQNMGFNMDTFFGGNLNPGFAEGGQMTDGPAGGTNWMLWGGIGLAVLGGAVVALGGGDTGGDISGGGDINGGGGGIGTPPTFPTPE